MSYWPSRSFASVYRKKRIGDGPEEYERDGGSRHLYVSFQKKDAKPSTSVTDCICACVSQENLPKRPIENEKAQNRWNYQDNIVRDCCISSRVADPKQPSQGQYGS